MSGETIETRIVAWASERPWWQQWVLRQFASGVAPTSELAETLADALVAGQRLEFDALDVDDVPGPLAAGAPVTLVEIANPDNVNALSNDQTLSFTPSGLTVVYGTNGSGKSGYARLVKDLVGGRHPERVRPNVFDAEAARKAQSAEVKYRVGNGEPTGATWPNDKPTELRAIGFYDEHCGNAYLRDDSELVFRPSALQLFDSLIEFSDLLRDKLERRITAVSATQPRLPALPDGTPAHEFVRKISGRTTSEQIDAATRLPTDFPDQLERAIETHSRLQGSNPAKERQRLNELAQAGRNVAAQLRAVDSVLGSTRLDDLERLSVDASAKREAARAASERSFDDLPMQGVGNAAWRALWHAAEAFAATADPGHAFPHLGDGATCVLCQQQLGTEGRSNFERFREYVADQTEQQARAAERNYAVALTKVRELRTQDPTAAIALSKVRAANKELADAVEQELVVAERLRTAVVEGTERSQLDLTESIATLTDWSQELSDRAAGVDDGTFASNLSTAGARLNELKGLEALAGAKADVGKLVAVRSELARLSGLKDSCETATITKKAGTLETEFVTAAVTDQFIRETDRLSLERIQLKRTGGRKGRTQHRPDLLGASGGNVMDVLSEGEQTALSLAGHLTEAAFDQTKSAIVFDDPVTSLDHERREKVARRLVELAADRQIIVFTHDMSFVRDLRKAAKADSVAFAERHVQRRGKNTPGLVSEQYPWAVKDVKARLQDLEERLAKLEKERGDLADTDYATRVAQIAGGLSQVWERMLSNELIGEVFNTGKGEVQVGKLKILARFSEEDDHDVQASYSRVSGWAPRHDQPVEDNYTPPEPEDVREEIEKARELFGRFRKYRN